MALRENNLRKLEQDLHDALIVGGGINGAVSAAALAGKGARVALIDQRDFAGFLIDQRDFAGFTSQQSSNLAWGGIKYLESGDYGLVRKLCLSRNHLIDSYPSRVKEIPSIKGSAGRRCSSGRGRGRIGCSATALPASRACCRNGRSRARNR